LREGRQCGVDHLSFTGGEPTLHRQFPDIIRYLCDADYTFSFVSNGSTFPQIYPLVLEHRRWFKGVTFSLDGAREETHDRLRDAGSYRQVLRAASICVARSLPFCLNMVLTARNRHEIEEMVELASKLGSQGVRFGHLMPTPNTALRKLDLSPEERREIESKVWALQKHSPVPIGMASGYYTTSPFFACGPLELEEFNLDCAGNLTLCCQLSGLSGPAPETDLMGSLQEMSLVEACERFRQRVGIYLEEKRSRVRRGEFGELDHFPCWYCVKYLDKVQGLQQIPSHPWMRSERSGKQSNDHIRTAANDAS
jgi:MoaA/NifB/PqqE/SkfB family radical SAM enzyme